jgi:hypothetical protein
LESATEVKEITWEKVKDMEWYRAAIGNNAVTIKKCYGKDGSQTGVSLLLYNSKGEEIDEIWTESDYVEFCSLHHLYECARRACLRVEETLDEMLAVLK